MSLRSFNELVMDNLLLLYLIDKTNRKGKLEELFKLQKLVFLVENNLIRKKIKAFNYVFFRWQKGPFSKDVSVDFGLLLDNGIITKDKEGIRLTKVGKELLKNCKKLLEENNSILKYFDTIINKYAPMSVSEIKEKVYNFKVTVPRLRKRMRIEDIPEGKIILFKVSRKKAKEIFKIDDEWLDTIEIFLNKMAYESLERAKMNITKGKIRYDKGLYKSL